MTKETFDIQYWLNINNRPQHSQKHTENVKKNTRDLQLNDRLVNHKPERWESVNMVVNEVERLQIDITSNYSDWRDLAFALSDSFGINGLEFFFRISCFNPGYKKAECEKQYFKCLYAGKNGITISTFFYIVNLAGITVTETTEPEIESTEELPTIPDEVYSSLPIILEFVCKAANSATERDLLLLGSLVTFSGCLPRVYGIYDRRKVYPNLYLFISAKASAGKGILNHCRLLVKKIHEDLREQSKELKEVYERDLNLYLTDKKKNPDATKPALPRERMLFIPANSSATGVFQLLDDNDGKGLMFETEGDTLANTFKSDYGNYSDGFRKAFHHEEMSYYRRTDREHVEIESPRLSTVLSGTPKQITNLIPDVENGLFSRFIFYHVNIKSEWHNVFDTTFKNGLDEQFTQVGELFYELFEHLNTLQPFLFQFTEEQEKRFNNFFRTKQAWYITQLGDDYTATIRRLGLIAHRIAMILSVLRIEKSTQVNEKLICNDQDFEITFQIVETLIKHSEYIFLNIQKNSTNPQIKIKKKENFYNNLPNTFTRKEYAEIASMLTITDKTAQRYISELIKESLIKREEYGVYSVLKPSDEEMGI
jgi:hypothetical protein